MYVFKFEPEIALLTVVRSGLWSVGTVAAYAAKLREQLTNLRHCGPSTSFIIDIRSSRAQPKDVADALTAMVNGLGPLHATRTAIVSSSGIAKLQAKRVADGNGQVFTSMVQARDWVMGADRAHRTASPVEDEACEADAEGYSVHVYGPADVDVKLTPAAALETAKRIENAAVEAILDHAILSPVGASFSERF